MATNYIENMEINTHTEASWKALKTADLTFPMPFMLSLQDSDKPLYCEKIIRIIPGKRIVVLAQWDDKQVVAKLFVQRSKAKIHCKRDVTGIEVLTAANVPTPALLFQGTDKSNHIHILIFERILDSCNLDVLWQEKQDIDELKPLMRAVTIELATQHVLGITQKDLHLKNFLVTSKKLYTLDGADIEYIPEILPKKESLQNLALFFAQLGVGTQALQQELFELYAKSRGWIIREADVQYLSQATKEYCEQRWLRYQQKIMRSCSAFEQIDKLNTLIMYDRNYQSPEFNQLLKSPDAFFAANGTKILKSGRSSTVAKIKIDNHFLVIKRYNIKNVLHWLRRCLRPTRATRSWQLANQLRLMGVSTAKPIAFIEKSFLGLRHKSYLIMEYVDGRHCGDYFSQYRADDPAYPQMAKRILNLFSQLAELHMTHGDLKMTNIIIHHDKPVLIDLDGMQEFRFNSSLNRAFKKEMQRFMKNWQHYPSVKELFKSLWSN